MPPTKSLHFNKAVCLPRATMECGSPVSYSHSCLLTRYFDRDSPEMDTISCVRVVCDRCENSVVLVAASFLIVPCSSRGLSATGSEAFLQSARIDLDKTCETARKKTVSGSGGAASLLIGNWREPLRLTLDVQSCKRLTSCSLSVNIPGNPYLDVQNMLCPESPSMV